MLSAALVEYLNGRAGLTALVASRFYESVVPQPTAGVNYYPAVTYQLISTVGLKSFRGSSGLSWSRYQITAWAQTPIAKELIRDALFDALQGFPWSNDPTKCKPPCWGDVFVNGVFLLDERDAPQISAGLQTARVYARQLDFQIGYGTPQPTFT